MRNRPEPSARASASGISLLLDRKWARPSDRSRAWTMTAAPGTGFPRGSSTRPTTNIRPGAGVGLASSAFAAVDGGPAGELSAHRSAPNRPNRQRRRRGTATSGRWIVARGSTWLGAPPWEGPQSILPMIAFRDALCITHNPMNGTVSQCREGPARFVGCRITMRTPVGIIRTAAL